jgi:hypothetical protein
MQAYKVALVAERRQHRSTQLALPAPSLDSSSGYSSTILYAHVVVNLDVKPTAAADCRHVYFARG